MYKKYGKNKEITHTKFTSHELDQRGQACANVPFIGYGSRRVVQVILLLSE